MLGLANPHLSWMLFNGPRKGWWTTCWGKNLFDGNISLFDDSFKWFFFWLNKMMKKFKGDPKHRRRSLWIILWLTTSEGTTTVAMTRNKKRGKYNTHVHKKYLWRPQSSDGVKPVVNVHLREWKRDIISWLKKSHLFLFFAFPFLFIQIGLWEYFHFNCYISEFLWNFRFVSVPCFVQ